MLELLVDAVIADPALYFCDDLIDAAHYKIVVLSSFPKGEVDGGVVQVVIDEFSWIVNFLYGCTYVFVDFLVESDGVLVEHVLEDFSLDVRVYDFEVERLQVVLLGKPN